MKAIICFSTILVFTIFTLEENKLSQFRLGTNDSAIYGLSLSLMWEETKKVDFSAIVEEINANLLPLANVYLLNEDVPLIEQ